LSKHRGGPSVRYSALIGLEENLCGVHSNAVQGKSRPWQSTAAREFDIKELLFLRKFSALLQGISLRLIPRILDCVSCESAIKNEFKQQQQQQYPFPKG
jgi:hypothetical protein